MIQSEIPLARSATHIVFDSLALERMGELGAVHVVRASDNLLVGPSRRDVVMHARERDLWWNSAEHEGWDRLCTVGPGCALPVVVWVAACLQERVNLWRTLHSLRQIGIPHRDILVVELEPVPSHAAPAVPAAPFDCTQSMAHHSSEVLSLHLATTRPWPQARHDQAARLWEQYVDVDPLPFVNACGAGVASFPELAPLWAFVSSFFPRRTPGGALRPSRFDALLLNVLSSDWQSPVSLFTHTSAPGEELRQLLSCTGDLFLPRRLEQWAEHGPVERLAGPRTDAPMLSFTYRLTAHGMELRTRGLAQISDVPNLPLAGTETSSWVLIEDGRLVSA